jgi:hypothetical protein
MEMVQVTIASWNRFVPRNLSIHPDLVGAVNHFPFEENEITIKLPSQRHMPTEPNRVELLTFNHYRELNGKKTPIELWVNGVDVEVSIAKEISLPRETLNMPPNAIEIIPKPQQEHLNHLAAAYGSIAERAFELWIRTLRWKCDNSAIGRPEISGCESGWSTYLIARPQDKRVWIASPVFEVRGAKMVTPEMWAEVEYSLKQGCIPPVYIDLMMDAAEHIKLDDLQRATVDMAIACETFLRMLVAKSLPSSLQSSVATYIDDANIRQVLEKFVPETLNEADRKELDKIKSTLHTLFDTRNNLVHKGQVSGLTKGLCEAFLETTKKLVKLHT